MTPIEAYTNHLSRTRLIQDTMMQRARLVRAIRRKREQIGLRDYLLSISDEPLDKRFKAG